MSNETKNFGTEKIIELNDTKIDASIGIYNVLTDLFNDGIITEKEFKEVCNKPSSIKDVAKTKSIDEKTVKHVMSLDSKRIKAIKERDAILDASRALVEQEIAEKAKYVREYEGELSKFKQLRENAKDDEHKRILDLFIVNTGYKLQRLEVMAELAKLETSGIVSDDIMEIAKTSNGNANGEGLQRGTKFEFKYNHLMDKKRELDKIIAENGKMLHEMDDKKGAIKVPEESKKDNIQKDDIQKDNIQLVSKEYAALKNALRNSIMYQTLLGQDVPGLSQSDIKRYVNTYKSTINDLRTSGKVSDDEYNKLYSELNKEQYILDVARDLRERIAKQEAAKQQTTKTQTNETPENKGPKKEEPKTTTTTKKEESEKKKIEVFKTPTDLIKKIEQDNKDVIVMVDPTNPSLTKIYTTKTGRQLTLPDGFYYSDEKGITNHNNTFGGPEYSIHVGDLNDDIKPSLVTLDEYNNPKKDNNKTNSTKVTFWTKVKNKAKEHPFATAAIAFGSGVIMTILLTNPFKGLFNHDKGLDTEKNKVDDDIVVSETAQPETSPSPSATPTPIPTSTPVQAQPQSNYTAYQDTTDYSSYSNYDQNEKVEVPADPEEEMEPSHVANRQLENTDAQTTSNENPNNENTNENENEEPKYSNIEYANTGETEIKYTLDGATRVQKQERVSTGDIDYTTDGAYISNQTPQTHTGKAIYTTDGVKYEDDTKAEETYESEAETAVDSSYDEQIHINEGILNGEIPDSNYTKADTVVDLRDNEGNYRLYYSGKRVEKAREEAQRETLDYEYNDKTISDIYGILQKSEEFGLSEEDKKKLAIDGINVTAIGEMYSETDYGEETAYFKDVAGIDKGYSKTYTYRG